MLYFILQKLKEEAELAQQMQPHANSHNHIDNPYTPTDEEIQAFMTFLRYVEHVEGGIKTTYSEVMQHLIRVHHLVHEMNRSGLSSLDQQDVIEWMNFYTFMDLGWSPHGHTNIN